MADPVALKWQALKVGNLSLDIKMLFTKRDALLLATLRYASKIFTFQFPKCAIDF